MPVSVLPTLPHFVQTGRKQSKVKGWRACALHEAAEIIFALFFFSCVNEIHFDARISAGAFSHWPLDAYFGVRACLLFFCDVIRIACVLLAAMRSYLKKKTKKTLSIVVLFAHISKTTFVESKVGDAKSTVLFLHPWGTF